MSKIEQRDALITASHFLAQLHDLEQWLVRVTIETADATRAEKLAAMADAAQGLHADVKSLRDALVAASRPASPS